MVGRTSDTSAISTRPMRSGKKRRRTTSCSTVIAGSPVRLSPSATWSKTTVPDGKQRYRHVAAQHRVEAGDVADLGLDRVAHRIGGDQQRQDDERRERRPGQGRGGKSKALDADGRDQDLSLSDCPAARRRSAQRCDRGASLVARVCVAFVAARARLWIDRDEPRPMPQPSPLRPFSASFWLRFGPLHGHLEGPESRPGARLPPVPNLPNAFGSPPFSARPWRRPGSSPRSCWRSRRGSRPVPAR